MSVSFSTRILTAKWARVGLSKGLRLSRVAQPPEDFHPEPSPVFHLTKIGHVSCCAKLFGELWVF